MSVLTLKSGYVQLLKFLGVGAFNTVMSLSIIYSLKWLAGWGDIPANMLGYAVGICVGFVLNGKWTFSRQCLKIADLLGYVTMTGIAYSLNLATVVALIRFVEIPGDAAQLGGVSTFTLTSFLLNRHFVFSRNDA